MGMIRVKVKLNLVFVYFRVKGRWIRIGYCPIRSTRARHTWCQRRTSTWWRIATVAFSRADRQIQPHRRNLTHKICNITYRIKWTEQTVCTARYIRDKHFQPFAVLWHSDILTDDKPYSQNSGEYCIMSDRIVFMYIYVCLPIKYTLKYNKYKVFREI